MSIRVDASVPAARIKVNHVLFVEERDKAVKASPSNKALSIDTDGCITPVDMWTIKIASIENRMMEHREIKRLQSRRWRFVDIDYSIIINIHAQPLSLRCSWRLINKGPFQSVMDKRGEAKNKRVFCLKKAQPVQSLVLLVYLQKCNVSPKGE